MSALRINVRVVAGEVRVHPHLHSSCPVETHLISMQLEVPRVHVQLQISLQRLSQDEKRVHDRNILDLRESQGHMLQVDISSILVRTSLPTADRPEGNRCDHGSQISTAVAPVEGLEVEAVLLLIRPGKLVLVNHGTSAAVAQRAPPSKTPLLLPRRLPLTLSDLLALGLQ